MGFQVTVCNLVMWCTMLLAVIIISGIKFDYELSHQPGSMACLTTTAKPAMSTKMNDLVPIKTTQPSSPTSFITTTMLATTILSTLTSTILDETTPTLTSPRSTTMVSSTGMARTTTITAEETMDPVALSPLPSSTQSLIVQTQPATFTITSTSEAETSMLAEETPDHSTSTTQSSTSIMVSSPEATTKITATAAIATTASLASTAPPLTSTMMPSSESTTTMFVEKTTGPATTEKIGVTIRADSCECGELSHNLASPDDKLLFKSPNFDRGNYCPDTECIFRLSVPPTFTAKFIFQEFEMEQYFDILRITKKDGSFISECTGNVCENIVSSDDGIVLQFSSDGSIERTGFRGILSAGTV